MTKRSEKIPLGAWSLLLFQRQDFLNNHLARVSITSYQEGTMKMKNEVLSRDGAQNMDTNLYQVSQVNSFENYRQNDQLDVDLAIMPQIPQQHLMI